MRLVVEAIKVVELMSALNMDDFQMNQWIFLVDSYGMAAPLETPAQMLIGQKGQQPDFEFIERDGIFQPFILRFMHNSSYSFYSQQSLAAEKQITVEQYMTQSEFIQKQIVPRQTSVQINKSEYEQDNYIETLATQLHITLNDLNTSRTEIDKTNFEGTIEKDFIDNDGMAK
jgi:hypothetical protein